MRNAAFYACLLGAVICGAAACITDHLYGAPSLNAWVGFAGLLAAAAVIQPTTPDPGLGE